MKRRNLLALVGGSAAAAVSGCLGEGSEGGTDDRTGEDEGASGDDGDGETPAFFEVTDLDPVEPTAEAGTVVDVSAEITNTGDEAGSGTVELRIDDETLASQDLELDGGESQAISFEADTADLTRGLYTHSVWTEDSEAEGTLTLQEAATASFELDSLDPAEATAAIGEVLPVSAEVTNTGDESGEKPVEFRLDGDTVLSRSVALDAGASQSITFEPELLDLAASEYTHSVWTEDDTVEGTLTILEEVGTLELSVVDTTGETLEGATVSGEGIDTETDATGAATLELEPGTYELAVAFRGVEQRVSVEVAGEETTTTTVEFDADAIAVEVTSFAAENTGGYIAFDESTRADAQEEGVTFPEGDVVIDGSVEDGEWESTDVSFAVLDAGLAQAEVEAPSGLRGTFDYENERMTTEGELEVTVAGETFNFEIAATTDESGDLSGGATFDPDGGTASLVDNEYVVEEETGGLVDSVLGLPVEEPGRCWLELPLALEFEQ